MSRTTLHFAAATVAGLSTLLGAEGDLRPLVAGTGLAPFGYTNAPEPLPNYVAGARWGTQTENITKMQLPLPPEESAKHMVTQPGFTSHLWAAEPDIFKPIALAWDDRGRLWIAETIDYPNEQQPDGQGRDRITICEDTDGDGKADKFTVFADKLSIPRSICFAGGGVIVLEGDHTLFLKDNNGDDKADERRVLFSGWGMGDTHATASNLRRGVDNWVYGTVGYSGFKGEVGGKKLEFGMGVFRFKTDGSQLEFLRSTDNNTWGLGLSEEGIVFGSTANRDASWYMPIPNRYYEGVAGWSAARLETIADSQKIYPITDRVRQVDQHGMYTAGAGHALYTARAFPAEFWNRIAFVAEPTGHLLGWYRLDPHGAGFTAVNLGSFLASDDEWTAPIVGEVGPDGALWVIDWYNYIVQHNPVPHGFKNGKGNAYETKLRDKRHGRIYRVTADGAPAAKSRSLAGATPAQLVAALADDNQLWRNLAQDRLVMRGDKDVVPALTALVRDSKPDAAGQNPGAVHALWTLHALGASGDAAQAALRNPTPGVRRAALGVLPRTDATVDTIVESGVLRDPDAQVRLAALLTLADINYAGGEDPAGPAIANFLTSPGNAGDRWLREAATAAAARHLHAFGRALIAGGGSLPAPALETVRIIARHYASSGPDDVTTATAALQQADPAVAGAVLDGLAAGWPEGKKLLLDDDAKSSLKEELQSFPAETRNKLLVVAQAWGALDLFSDQVTAAVEDLKKSIDDKGRPDPARVTSAQHLLALSDTAASVSAILAEITPEAAPPLSGGFFGVLSKSRQAGTGKGILALWNRLSPGQRRGALGVVVRRPEWAAALLDAVASGAVQRNDLGPEHWQQLRSSANTDVAKRAAELVNGGLQISADRQDVVKAFLPAAKATGDPDRGKEVFVKNCGVCHKLAGVGASIGPELTGVGARAKEDILIDILDPNRSVEANYRLWNLTTKSGDSYSGRLDSESQTSVELLDLTGQKHTVQRKDIASLESSNQSIMPTGFESLGEKDITALLAYLATSVEGPAKR
jgi:uncharacterized protein